MSNMNKYFKVVCNIETGSQYKNNLYKKLVDNIIDSGVSVTESQLSNAIDKFDEFIDGRNSDETKELINTVDIALFQEYFKDAVFNGINILEDNTYVNDMIGSENKVAHVSYAYIYDEYRNVHYMCIITYDHTIRYSYGYMTRSRTWTYDDGMFKVRKLSDALKRVFLME